jgi:trimethylamine--corrinoid protein Co-methyltransferase
MPHIKINLLSDEDIAVIHQASLDILGKIGLNVQHAGVLDRLAQAGAWVEPGTQRVRFPERLVAWGLAQAGKQFILHGRDPARVARFGYGEHNLLASPGQVFWFDHHTGERRQPVLEDTRQAARLADALPNITIAGALSVPRDVPMAIRDVVLISEMVRNTGKPCRCWPIDRRSSRYVLEIYQALAGGVEALRQSPMTEFYLDPVSPLQLPEWGLDIAWEFVEHGQPVTLGSLTMSPGTGPVTLAGSLAQANAEILAGVIAMQAIRPGTPVMYGGIPHLLDMRTMICSFGSPEQGLMAVAMAQMGQHYSLPVYINVNLTDSKTLDAQAGLEKMSSLTLGMLAGADLFGHAGIVGSDHGGSLAWLVVDNEALEFARRVSHGFTLDEAHLALDVIAEVGPGGNYIDQEHTAKLFRQEYWLPGKLWARDTYDGWEAEGATSMAQRAASQVDRILATHQPPPPDEALSKEIDRIVGAAHEELVR